MLENIKTRRSCRNYLDKEVSDEFINEVVECGLLAPSGMNTQGIEFCVITNKEILKEMAVKDVLTGCFNRNAFAEDCYEISDFSTPTESGIVFSILCPAVEDGSAKIDIAAEYSVDDDLGEDSIC